MKKRELLFRATINSCEVLIIGAGPAGVSLASFLAGKGIDCILIDKKKRIDTPLRCAEYVPAAIARLFDRPIPGVNCSIVSMDTYIDYKYANTMPSPGFMLDRPVFLKSLVDSFRENGGKFMPGTKAVSFDGEHNGGCKKGSGSTGIRHRNYQKKDSSRKDILQTDYRGSYPGMVSTVIQGPGGERSVTRSKLVVGADGPNSIVARQIGSKVPNYVLGLVENIPVTAKDKKKTLIFCSSEIEGGYGWLFPKDGSTNLGIGCQFIGSRKNINMVLKKIYMDFKKKVFLMDFFDLSGSIAMLSPPVEASLTAGLIPASGMLQKTVSGSFILAGDAAGLTNPITGAGIYNAVYSAKIISDIIPRALKTEDSGLLAMIEKDYENTFGTSLRRALGKRKILMSGWDSATGSGNKKNFEKLTRRCWVSFKDYWRP